ncbi:MAG: hypothetical protein M3124_00565 [Actinomycetota bacterium]|nr:hypothetical protein [Actinomycetota bacterium]
MAVHEMAASGLEYLALATELLQPARLADADAGVWEAADLQWWWRTPRRSDAIGHLFWIDEEGPAAAVILTDWGRAWQCDPIVIPGPSPISLPTVCGRALATLKELGLEAVEVVVREDDFELMGLLTEAGFVAGDDRSGITWMEARKRPDVAAVPVGFRLSDCAKEATQAAPDAAPKRRRDRVSPSAVLALRPGTRPRRRGCRRSGRRVRALLVRPP